VAASVLYVATLIGAITDERYFESSCFPLASRIALADMFRYLCVVAVFFNIYNLVREYLEISLKIACNCFIIEEMGFSAL